jgi:hypothetical protein
VLTVGCGRVGVELVPQAIEAPSDADTEPAPTSEVGEPDAGEHDASEPDASEPLLLPSLPTDPCASGVCSLSACADPQAKASPLVCGCDTPDTLDSDADGTPDCIDACPGVPDRQPDGRCGCAAANADPDGDGVPSCAEWCPRDPDKRLPGFCGCGNPDTDTDADGAPDCVDTCSGAANQLYTPNAACGVGYCRATSSPSSCSGGAEMACVPGVQRTALDAMCDGVDDDCDSAVDEEYVSMATQCGRGACARTGMLSCSAGAEVDSCVAAAPSALRDDTLNGIDDDCDGLVDEDVPGCESMPRSFEVGAHSAIAVPPGCRHVTVRLWGGAGAGGENVGLTGAGGAGGPGGYASSTLAVTEGANLTLYVGAAGAAGCTTPGANGGSPSYGGGGGGDGAGRRGADGTGASGGNGGAPSQGYAGGDGYFGGGGGGQGHGGLGASGAGGGGGAASVLLLNGSRVAVAGGGGGGGGAQAISPAGSLSASGGAGGSGCHGDGRAETSYGGGGGGGGICIGNNTQTGTGAGPAFASDLPNGRARGGSRGCNAGGAGYAIVSFSP